jgi:hypothetical protein
VVLRRALSNQNTPFETLIRLGEDLPDKNRPALPQICKAKQEYRMNRRLSRPEQAQLVEEYQSGKSTFDWLIASGSIVTRSQSIYGAAALSSGADRSR